MKEVLEEYGSALLGAAGSLLSFQLAARFLCGENGLLQLLLQQFGGIR